MEMQALESPTDPLAKTDTSLSCLHTNAFSRCPAPTAPLSILKHHVTLSPQKAVLSRNHIIWLEFSKEKKDFFPSVYILSNVSESIQVNI